ncbi:MAG: 50S ribosomal protein L20 [Nitrospinota bacterium]
MPRATHAPASKRRHKRLLKRAQGYWGRRRNNYRIARETVERALAFAYRDRRQRKREFRRLWITRINAASREHGLSYSQLIHGLDKAQVALDRKVIADLAVHDSEAFAKLAALAKEHV